MRTTSTRCLCLPLLASLGLAGPALAGSGPPPMVQTVCQSCHGSDGVAVMPGAANLSGQQKEYLVTQLRAYRSGSRQSEQMSIVAKSLTDADIESLAEWYASIKVTVTAPK